MVKLSEVVVKKCVGIFYLPSSIEKERNVFKETYIWALLCNFLFEKMLKIDLEILKNVKSVKNRQKRCFPPK